MIRQVKQFKKKCLICGKSFMSARNWTKLCGENCRLEYKRREYLKKHPNKIWLRKKRKCLICGKIYIPNQWNQKYCSRVCQDIASKNSLKNTQWYKLRFEILERDHFTCQYCGASPRKNPEVKLHIDHKDSKKNGGKDEKDNLITACEYCNLGKGHQFYPNIFKNDF